MSYQFPSIPEKHAELPALQPALSKQFEGFIGRKIANIIHPDCFPKPQRGEMCKPMPPMFFYNNKGTG